MLSQKFSPKSWSKFKTLSLADPEFYKSRPVDMLLSADIFYRVLAIEKLDSPPGEPTAVKTLFGWIIYGEICHEIETLHSCLSSLPNRSPSFQNRLLSLQNNSLSLQNH